MSADTRVDPASAPAAAGSTRARRYAGWLGVAVVLALLVRSLAVESVHVSNGAMAPTLRPADRILMSRLATPHVGDVVVADVSSAWGTGRRTYVDDGAIGRVLSAAARALGVALDEEDVVLRVAAVGGDRVRSDQAGTIRVGDRVVRRGRPLPTAGAQAPWEVTVPAGTVWLLADRAGIGPDSATHARSANAGAVPRGDVVGVALGRFWPLARAGSIGGSTEASGLGE